MLKKHLKSLIKLDKFLDKHAILLISLALVVILRIPNFYEPYWYGDEGIYLTIGQALNKGEKLYTDIVDHKTPVIYYLARVGTQLNFRVLNLSWMFLATIFFYVFAFRLTNRRLASGMATILFVTFTTLPWFEGNIPNGELFVVGFVMLGLMLISFTTYFTQFISTQTAQSSQESRRQRRQISSNKKERNLLIFSGMSFGLATLTKVPALFDFGASLIPGFFLLTNTFALLPARALNKWKKSLLPLLRSWLLIIAGFAIPVIFSIIYFVLRGSGADYLQYGLLYNLHYAGNWGLPFKSQLLIKAFSLPGKFALTTALILLATYYKRYLQPKVQFLIAWFVLALFASLLSNRPYPHYFIQVFPPLTILVGLGLNNLIDLARSKCKVTQEIISNLVVAASATLLMLMVLASLHVGVYPVKKYYQNWWLLRTGQLSISEYNRKFNYLMDDNYQAAKMLKEESLDKMFVWGTNPMLYAQSGVSPVGRFTVSFHIADLSAYSETMQAIEKEQPEVIVVMNNERNSFTDLTLYLEKYYKARDSFENFIIWRRIAGDENI